MTGPHEPRTTIGRVIAEQTLRALRRRLFFGRVHGDVVAEVTGRRRPDDGIVVIALLTLASVAVAFVVGFASVVVAGASTDPAGAAAPAAGASRG